MEDRARTCWVEAMEWKVLTGLLHSRQSVQLQDTSDKRSRKCHVMLGPGSTAHARRRALHPSVRPPLRLDHLLLSGTQLSPFSQRVHTRPSELRLLHLLGSLAMKGFIKAAQRSVVHPFCDSPRLTRISIGRRISSRLGLACQRVGSQFSCGTETWLTFFPSCRVVRCRIRRLVSSRSRRYDQS